MSVPGRKYRDAAKPTLQATFRAVRRRAGRAEGHPAGRTNGRLASGRPRADAPPMTKRVIATLLWFYAGWYAGAMTAALFGISPALGPIFAVAAAAIIGGDPRGIIWGRTGKA